MKKPKPRGEKHGKSPRNTRRLPGRVPLSRALSKLGLASRTQAEDWIRNGRLSVDGVVRTNPKLLVVPEGSKFELDGRPLRPSGRRAFLLHKPRQTVTTRSDEKKRATVFSLVEKLEEKEGLTLHAVGRLDQATTGLLILTNDSKLSAWLTDPVNRVTRVYLVTVRGEVSPEEAQRLENGIRDEGELLRAEKVELRKSSGRESHLTVTLTQGKNREIRRLFEAIGHEVTRLKRVSFGGLELGELEAGHWRELGREEILAAFPGISLRL